MFSRGCRGDALGTNRLSLYLPCSGIRAAELSLRTFGYRVGQDRSTDLCLVPALLAELRPGAGSAGAAGTEPPLPRGRSCRRGGAGAVEGRPRSPARTSARPPHGKFPLKRAASPAAAAVRVSLRGVRARAGAPRREAGAELSAWPVSSGGAGPGWAGGSERCPPALAGRGGC